MVAGPHFRVLILLLLCLLLIFIILLFILILILPGASPYQFPGVACQSPQREDAGETLHGNTLVTFPSQPLVLPGAQLIEILFGVVAQPDFRVLDSSDNAGGEVHGAAEYIAIVHMHRADVNAGADLNLGMSGVRVQSHRIVQCRCSRT